MKDFVCKKCGNTTYTMQEKLNGTGKAIGLYCAKCGTWHKWLNKQEKVLYSTHSAEIDKDKEIARLTAENAELKKRLGKAVELPCIEPMTTWDWDDTTGLGKSNFGKYWKVLYRDEDGEFMAYMGATKAEAEAMLAELKGGNE